MPGGNRVLEFRIMALNLVRRGAMAARRELEGLRRAAHAISAVGHGLTRAWGLVRSTFLRVAAGAAVAAFALGVTLKKAFMFEEFTLQFKILFGDMERAKKHMADLAEFSARTPFQIAGITEASRQLHILSGGALGGVKSLRLIGDAAGATGQQIEEVAFWVGRMYSMIAGGRPLGIAGRRLQQMAVLTGTARNKMEDLQKSGGSAAEIFGVLYRDLARFEGGMVQMSQTGSGLVSTFRDNLNLALADFGKVLEEDAKHGLRSMIEWLQRLRSDGTIERWATKAREALEIAAEVAKALLGGGGDEKRKEALTGIKDILIGAWRMAVHKAVDLLVEAAPLVGKMIGDAARKAIDLKDFYEADTAALKSMKDEGLINSAQYLMPGSLLNYNQEMERKRRREEIQRNQEAADIKAGKDRIRRGPVTPEQQFQSGVNRLTGFLPDKKTRALSGQQSERHLQFAEQAAKYSAAAPGSEEREQARRVLEGMYRSFEEFGAKAGTGMWKDLYDAAIKEADDGAKLLAEVQGQLTKVEVAEVEAAKNKIKGILGANDLGPEAFQKALDQMKQKFKETQIEDLENVRTDIRKVLMDPALKAEDKRKQIDELRERQKSIEGRKFEDTAGQSETWRQLGKATAKELKDLQGQEQEKQERITTKRDALEEQQRKFQVSLLSPEEQKKASESRIGELKKQMAAEPDKEKKLDIGKLLQDEIENLSGLTTKGKTRTSIGMGDIFTKLHGQDVGEADPQRQQVTLLTEIRGVLQSIDGKGGIGA